MVVRQRLAETLKEALRSREADTVSTVRLILAAVKDRDIAERGRGNAAGLSDEQIFSLLQSMIKQRQESIGLYRQGGRDDLAAKEAAEIIVIEGFLPQQLSEADATAAIEAAIAETGAASVKDMGRVMAILKQRCAGRMDMSQASAAVKARLG
jgi:uncharacterized protein YqeY